MKNENHRKQRIEELLLNFVACGSFTNKAESEIEDFFRSWIGQNDYFSLHQDHWGFSPVKNDPLKRNVAWCLVKGHGNKTVVLVHHHDIVDTLEYGKDAPLALNPRELTALYQKRHPSFPKELVGDAKACDWLFGRGVADMKAGAAIQLQLIEEYCKKDDFSGNILLLSVCDEENLSAGMTSASFLLKELKQQYDLDYKMMINCEPHTRRDDTQATIYQGSIGKIMPLFFIWGQTSHVSEVYESISANSIMSELIRRIELNPEFIEHVGTTTSPPPAVLLARDLKPSYDVSLPQSAWFLLNILPLQTSPLELLNKLKAISYEAVAQVENTYCRSYKHYCKISQIPFSPKTWTAKVLLFEELFEAANTNSDSDFNEAYTTLLTRLTKQYHDNQITIHQCSRQLIECCLHYSDLPAPVIVIALTPPFYPSVHNNMLNKSIYQCCMTLIAGLLEFSQQQNNQKIEVMDYFTGISDLSYAGFYHSFDNIECLQANMPGWHSLYSIALDIIKELSMPVLNIGPWGKDCHTRYERVYKDDVFEKTPALVCWAVDYILKND